MTQAELDNDVWHWRSQAMRAEQQVEKLQARVRELEKEKAELEARLRDATQAA